ncbi:MAG: UPF0365 family protein [Clostridia bacterium]|nr:UPF0365 family protein [Clostridia bacterium]
MFLDYLWLLILGVIFVASVIIFCILVPVKVWLKAIFSGVRVSPRVLSSLKLRKINANLIVDEYIYAIKAGIQVALGDLETHFISGGNIRNVVDAMIATKNVSVDLSVDTAKAIDLSGANVSEIVNESITPKEIVTPVISAFTMDGVEILVTLSITLKTNLEKFLGGAKEKTIISRATEGVVCIVSSAKEATEILQNVDLISNFVQTRNIDEKTAYDLLSVDILKLERGRDLKQEHAEYERDRRNQETVLKVEEEKLLYILEQEKLKAKAEQERLNRAKLEAEVPKALLKAFENGKIEAMDYYKMQNIIADTNMRKALSETPAKAPETKKIKFDFESDDDDEK